jgi:hypothetical protein
MSKLDDELERVASLDLSLYDKMTTRQLIDELVRSAHEHGWDEGYLAATEEPADLATAGNPYRRQAEETPPQCH